VFKNGETVMRFLEDTSEQGLQNGAQQQRVSEGVKGKGEHGRSLSDTRGGARQARKDAGARRALM